MKTLIEKLRTMKHVTVRHTSEGAAFLSLDRPSGRTSVVTVTAGMGDTRSMMLVDAEEADILNVIESLTRRLDE